MSPGRSSIRLYFAAIVIATLQACTLFKTDPARLEQRADAALAKGDTASALKLLDGVVHSDGAPAERYAQMGAICRSSGTITGRLRSQQVLESGLQRYPNDGVLWLELGKTNYAQTFYGDASRCFQRVLELDPEHCEAHLYLGLDWYRKWKYVQVYRDYLQSAIPYFQYVLECAPRNRAASFKLAVSFYALADTTASVDEIECFIKRHPDAAGGYLLRGAIAYQRANYAVCDSLFDAGLSIVSEEERDNLRDIVLLLTEQEVPEYKFASDKKRRQMQSVFWGERDPDPTTPLNERYLEHIQRMFLADVFFDNQTPRLRGWQTERGKAMIKFGWPDGVQSTLAGESLSGRMEVWVYSNEFVGLTLFFRDEFLNGNYMVPMDYRYSFAAQALYLDPPASHYVSPYWEIPGVMDVLAFRGPSASTDVYLAMKIDLRTMGEHLDLAASPRFFIRTSFLDDEWQAQSSHADTLAGDSFWRRNRRGEEWYHIVRDFDLAFESVRVAFCLEDDLARTQTLLSGRANTAKFLSDSLVLSDILLYRPVTEQHAAALIRRGGKTFFPNPGGFYNESEKLRLYVEVYNLQLTQSHSEYEITYSIYDARQGPKGWARIRRGLKNMMGFRSPPEPVISHTLQRSATRHRAAEDLAIDISALQQGKYVLQITVRDHKSGEETNRTRTFAKAIPEPGRLVEER
jgi:GWxTD domain-containing protein